MSHKKSSLIFTCIVFSYSKQRRYITKCSKLKAKAKVLLKILPTIQQVSYLFHSFPHFLDGQEHRRKCLEMSFFHYVTYKYVIIKDKRLGVAYYVLAVAIILYTLVQLLINKSYLQVKGIFL